MKNSGCCHWRLELGLAVKEEAGKRQMHWADKVMAKSNEAPVKGDWDWVMDQV